MSSLNHNFQPLISRLRKDLRGVGCLVCTGILVAWLGNTMRPDGLPMVYQTPAERLGMLIPVAHLSAEEVGVTEVRSWLQRPEILFIDARSATFYELGHLPGAVNLSRKNYEQDFSRLRERLFDPRLELLVVYCSGVDCEDSHLVAGLLRQHPLPLMHIFRGGWEAWEKAGGVK
jgi:rhodanese-related sulfurtransferase